MSEERVQERFDSSTESVGSTAEQLAVGDRIMWKQIPEIDVQAYEQALNYGWAIKPLEGTEGVVSRFQRDLEQDAQRLNFMNEWLANYLREQQTRDALTAVTDGQILKQLVSTLVDQDELGFNDTSHVWSQLSNHVRLVRSEQHAQAGWIREEECRQRFEEKRQEIWNDAFYEGIRKEQERHAEQSNKRQQEETRNDTTDMMDEARDDNGDPYFGN